MRILGVIVAISVVLTLWMHDSLSVDRVTFSFKSLESQSSWNMSLSDVFFPVSDSPAVDPLVHKNSKALNALVSCMEHRNCHQNQTKGALISTFICVQMLSTIRIVVLLGSPYFQDYLKGSRGGESIWYEFCSWFRSTDTHLAHQGTLYSTVMADSRTRPPIS
jgi:hypothetical protein